jgi:hypothetical protein
VTVSRSIASACGSKKSLRAAEQNRPDVAAARAASCWYGWRQLAARARLDQHGWGREAIAWQAHIGGFLAGHLAFAAFDPIPISTGGGPNEGMDAPPPAINLDTIAGCAPLAMSRRSRRRSPRALRMRCPW